MLIRKKILLFICCAAGYIFFLPKTALSTFTPHPVSLYEQGKKILIQYKGKEEDLQSAEKIFQALITRYPDSPFGFLGMSQVKVYKSYLYGNDYNMRIIQDEVMPYAIRALELGPTLEEVHENYAFLEKILADDYLQKKAIQTLLALAPRDPETFFQLGLFVLKQNDFANAEDYLSAALELGPSLELRVKILKRLGWLNLYHRDDPNKAIEFYHAILKNGENAEIDQYLGLAYYKAGQYGKAIEQFSRVDSKFKSELKQYYLMLAKGRLFEENGKIPEAIEYFEGAARYRSLDSETHFMLGNLYFGQNDYARAYQHFREVIDLSPEYAKAYYLAGRAVHSLGKLSVAATLFSKYLTLGAETQNAEWIRQNVPNLTQTIKVSHE